MPLGISEKLWTHPRASGYHTHNVGGFKALACLCLRLTANLDELHIVHGKQKGTQSG